MSIELDVKLRQPNLRRRDVINTVLDTWGSLSIKDASINIEGFSLDPEAVVNGKCPPIEIGIGERASVRCDFYFVDGEPDEPESGLWAVVAVGVRNVESMLLMAVVGLALAKVGESSVVDEAGILKGSGILSISQIDRLTAVARGLPLGEAAGAFASQIA